MVESDVNYKKDCNVPTEIISAFDWKFIEYEFDGNWFKIFLFNEYLEKIAILKNLIGSLKEPSEWKVQLSVQFLLRPSQDIDENLWVITKKLWLVNKQMKLWKNFLNHFLPSIKKIGK